MSSTTPAPSSHPDRRRPARGRTGTFQALGDSRYRLLWFGSLLSFLSVQMQMIARGWLAFSLTGHNKGLGAVFLGFGLPMLLITPWGGVAADRLSKRRVLMGSQLVLALSSGAIAAAISFDVIAYWMLIASAVVQGAGFSFLGPARMAFTGELVGRERLGNAIVLQQLSMNSTRILGPAVAGAMIGIAVFGIGGVYWATTALMLGAMAMSFRLPAGNASPDRQDATPLAELRDGVRYVRDRPLLLLLVITSAAVIMTAFPYIAFLPTLAASVFDVGPSGYGAMSAVSAVGALMAALLIASRADGRGAWHLQVAAGLAFGIGVAMLAFAPSYAIALAVILGIGAASSVFQALNNSLALQSTDFEYHGRVQSLLMLSFSGFGMAALPLGALADAFGLRITMLGMGALAATAVALYAVARTVLQRRAAETESPVVAPARIEPGVAEQIPIPPA